MLRSEFGDYGSIISRQLSKYPKNHWQNIKSKDWIAMEIEYSSNSSVGSSTSKVRYIKLSHIDTVLREVFTAAECAKQLPWLSAGTC